MKGANTGRQAGKGPSTLLVSPRLDAVLINVTESRSKGGGVARTRRNVRADRHSTITLKWASRASESPSSMASRNIFVSCRWPIAQSKTRSFVHAPGDVLGIRFIMPFLHWSRGIFSWVGKGGRTWGSSRAAIARRMHPWGTRGRSIYNFGHGWRPHASAASPHVSVHSGGAGRRGRRACRTETGGGLRQLSTRVASASWDLPPSGGDDGEGRSGVEYLGLDPLAANRGQYEGEEEYEEEVALPEVCPGCGVQLQIDDPDGPGYCRVPERVIRFLESGGVVDEAADETVDNGLRDDLGDVKGSTRGVGGEVEVDISQFVTVKLDVQDLDGLGLPGMDDMDEEEVGDDVGDKDDGGGDSDAAEGGFNEMIRALNVEELSSADGSSSSRGKKSGEKREPKPRVFRDEEDEDLSLIDEILSSLVCERCYSLKHYGKIKSASAEAFLPDFDVAASVGEAVRSRQFRRAILLVVVDLADFDGSLPRLTIQKLVQEYLNKNFAFVVVANKADLLPKQATRIRLEQWVRRRIAQGGLPKPQSVHIVSSQSGAGIKTLLVDLQKSLGGGGARGGGTQAGDIWVVGAQNAGKSSLINAMKKAAGIHRDSQEVTAAPMPGTTLGVVPVTGGLVPKGCEMLDTPGVRHEYQITSQLGLEEVRMLLPRRSLKPRTYRLGEGSTIHLGGLARLDVTSVPGPTMYVTVWLSDEVRTHLGKTANAAALFGAHVGRDLTPPIAANEDDLERRIKQDMPIPVPTEVSVTGDTWKESSVDVCIAGLGWLAVGVSGEARVTVWAPPGVAITTRDAIVPDFAKEFCKPGFDKLLQRANSSKGAKKGGGKKAAKR